MSTQDDETTKVSAGLVTRRAALAGAGFGALALAACGDREQGPPAPVGIFRHGVASGDPRTDAVIIWTRVTRDDDDETGGGGSVDVIWDVARDDAFADIVATGTAGASAARDYTVKVDVTDLAPGSAYFYRFRLADEVSTVGRLRTLPVLGASQYRLAAVSCANYPAGWFNVYRDLSQRDDVDVVLHLGDYIYEYGPGGYATDWGKKHGRIPNPPHEIVSLEDYRGRYAQYRSDIDLQAAHAAHTWICSWDDHETANDSWSTGAQNHQSSEGAWSDRRSAAMSAYYDWMPLRDPAPGRAAEALWRTYELGGLASLILLETRLSGRDEQPDWTNLAAVLEADRNDPALPDMVRVYNDEVVADPEREMLGRAQANVVAMELASSTSRNVPWQILGSQVILSKSRAPDFASAVPGWLKQIIKTKSRGAWAFVELSRYGVPLNTDAWDGYPAARTRLYEAAERAGAKLISLAGDTHIFSVNALRTDDGRTIGAEFGGSSVTSPSSFQVIPSAGVDYEQMIMDTNPDDILHYNIYDRGYVILNLTADEAVGEFIRVDTIESREFTSETYTRWRARADGDGVTIEEI